MTGFSRWRACCDASWSWKGNKCDILTVQFVFSENSQGRYTSTWYHIRPLLQRQILLIYLNLKCQLQFSDTCLLLYTFMWKNNMVDTELITDSWDGEIARKCRVCFSDQKIDSLRQVCSVCFDNLLATCVPSTSSSQCHQLVHQRPCHMLSCL